MYIVNPEDGTCTPFMHKQNKLQETIDRVKDELSSWQEYKTMSVSEPRYAQVAVEEFQHGLMALSDMFTEMAKSCTEKEHNELRHLLQAHMGNHNPAAPTMHPAPTV